MLNSSKMNRLSSLLAGGFLLSLTFVGCQQPAKTMDPETRAAKADSVARSRMQMVADSMMNECSSNQAMMVQMKADSLYNAAIAAMPNP
jgi:hypothetical protein